jgi:hypothetical protein
MYLIDYIKDINKIRKIQMLAVYDTKCICKSCRYGQFFRGYEGTYEPHCRLNLNQHSGFNGTSDVAFIRECDFHRPRKEKKHDY